VGAAVTETHLNLTAMDEVGLLLRVVVMDAGRVALGQHDRVDAERGHVELAPDLAEAGPLSHPFEARDRVAVALQCVVHGGAKCY